eukprot:gnl/MRDRNA2_/MRDRNA2_303266_c0_seq1.p1 gnl/MRDRNA2_/MRDRNA2_303266_c0~~gnl/MRDRNA2_/MRDRNA2_303266_c0_seq1.p1  ORF type:complete len:366 (-),score=59.44 gnl/MRDRNA2_/MRDRNA2_303266_c0_seq1:8-1105(-)
MIRVVVLFFFIGVRHDIVVSAVVNPKPLHFKGRSAKNVRKKPQLVLQPTFEKPQSIFTGLDVTAHSLKDFSSNAQPSFKEAQVEELSSASPAHIFEYDDTVNWHEQLSTGAAGIAESARQIAFNTQSNFGVPVPEGVDQHRKPFAGDSEEKQIGVSNSGEEEFMFAGPESDVDANSLKAPMFESDYSSREALVEELASTSPAPVVKCDVSLHRQQMTSAASVAESTRQISSNAESDFSSPIPPHVMAMHAENRATPGSDPALDTSQGLCRWCTKGLVGCSYSIADLTPLGSCIAYARTAKTKSNIRSSWCSSDCDWSTACRGKTFKDVQKCMTPIKKECVKRCTTWIEFRPEEEFVQKKAKCGYG